VRFVCDEPGAAERVEKFHLVILNFSCTCSSKTQFVHLIFDNYSNFEIDFTVIGIA
jgi:hypothetical protein